MTLVGIAAVVLAAVTIAGVEDYPRESVEAYPFSLSVSPGESISFGVSSRAGAVDGFVERVGVSARVVGTFEDVAAEFRSLFGDVVAAGCGWPASIEIPIGADWESGLYRATFRAPDGSTTTAPFIVRAAAPGRVSKVLALRPDFTIHAYNAFGGACLYPSSFGPAASVVSFERPIRIYAEGPAKWNEAFLTYLEGITPLEYASEIDLHSRVDLLDPYDALLLFGHHEYWTREMRERVHDFVGNGGRVVVLHGNTCYWQVRVEADGRAIRCHKLPASDPHYVGRAGERMHEVTTIFAYPPVLDPPDRTFGLEFRHASWGAMPPLHDSAPTPFGTRLPSYPLTRLHGAFRVHQPAHAAFAGLGVTLDASFGAVKIRQGEQLGLVALVRGEVDGANVERIGDRVLASSASGAPRNLLVLATAPAEQGFAAMASFEDHGSVFHGGVEGWPEAFGFDGKLVTDVARAVTDIVRAAVEPRRSLVRDGGFERSSLRSLAVTSPPGGEVGIVPAIASGAGALSLRGSASGSARARLATDVEPSVARVFVGAFVEGDRSDASFHVDFAGRRVATWRLSDAGYTCGFVDLPSRDATRALVVEVEQRGSEALFVDQLEVMDGARFSAECSSALTNPSPGAAAWLVLAESDEPDSLELIDVDRDVVLDHGVPRALGPRCDGFVANDVALGRLVRVNGRARSGASGIRVLPLRCRSQRSPAEAFSDLEWSLASDLFSNGDFEMTPSASEIAAGADWTDRPPHWAIDPQGAASLDSSRAAHGSRSLRLDASVRSARATSPVADPLATDRPWLVEVSVYSTHASATSIAVYATAFGKLRATELARATVEAPGAFTDVALTVEPEDLSPLGRHAALQAWIDVTVERGTAWIDCVRVSQR